MRREASNVRWRLSAVADIVGGRLSLPDTVLPSINQLVDAIGDGLVRPGRVI